MSPIAANSTLEDADWDAQKSTIQRLYITEDRSLQALTEIMAVSHSFRASKAQYERHFKQWGLRKNLKSHEWKAVQHHTSKRKLHGKESDLYVDGILIPNKKVRKETSRNDFKSTFDRIAQAPSPRIPDGLIICTPSASGMGTLPTNSLPWYQFAASLDKIGEPSFASSHASAFWQKILCRSAQSASSDELNIASPDTMARRDSSQGLVPSTSILSNLDVSQDNRFSMIAAFIDIRRERSANNLPSTILNALSVLPENAECDLGHSTQTPIMQISKLLMFLLSNNHVSDSIKDSLGIEDSSGLDKFVLGLLRACNSLQRKRLLSHGGPTSEALLEKMFQSALRAQDEEICQILLDYGVDPNKQGFIHIYKPLQIALRDRSIAIATMLMNAGADVNGSLEYAVISGQTGMVNLLLAKGAHANTEDGAKALRLAVGDGDIVQVRSLISAGADVDWVYESEQTALYWADEESEMVKVLLQAGADVNAVAYDIAVVEHFVRYGSTGALRSLLDGRPEIFGDAVYFAVDHGDLEILQILLNGGADVNACFKHSRRTPLTRAVEKQSIGIVKFLLGSGADVNGCTLAHDSLEYSDLPLLIGDGYHPDDTLLLNYTPLQAASFHQDTEIAKILIEAGADVNMDCTAPTDSKFRGFIMTIREHEDHLVFYGTAVQIAARQGNMALIRLLCHAGADVNAPAYRWGGRTALQAAVESENYSVIGFLLAAGADVNAAAAERDGITALAAAIASQDPKILSSMHEEGANFEETSAGPFAVTALAAATANRDVRLVRILLRAGANPVDSAALQAAVANDDIELVRILISALADLHVDGDEDYGYMALYTATVNARHELIKFLLASEIDPDIQMPEATGLMSYVPQKGKWVYDIEAHKTSPWFVALRSEDLQLVQIFLKAGADPNQIPLDKVDMRGFANPTGLHLDCLLFATMRRHLRLMQMLLEAGADVDVNLDSHVHLNPEYLYFNTALGWAARHGQIDSVRLLLQAGANPNFPANGRYQCTALQAATKYGYEHVVEILLQAGADVNAPPCPYGGMTALQAAAIQGYLRLARVLTEAGADVNAVAAYEKGRTALEGAGEHGRIDMLQYLLNNGASIEGAGRAQYESAINLAEKNGHLSASNLLKSHHRSLYGSS